MARYECVRCHAIYHVVNGFIDGTDKTEHLCKDLAKRWERREKQRDAVLDILQEQFPIGREYLESIAEEIVEALIRLQINMED